MDVAIVIVNNSTNSVIVGFSLESLAKGKNASFHAVLFDDTLMAFEVRGIKMEFFFVVDSTYLQFLLIQIEKHSNITL